MKDLLCARLCEEKRLYPPGCNRFLHVVKYRSQDPPRRSAKRTGWDKRKAGLRPLFGFIYRANFHRRREP
nr:MAG TPA: hypothetical protein [Caudoviricetes sp.]